MNPNGTTGPIPISIKNANPLLFTLPQENMNIQPYWIMLAQVIVVQAFSRMVNRFSVGVWWTTVEIGLIIWLIKFYTDILPKLLDLINSLLMATTAPPPPLRSHPRIIAYFIPTNVQRIQHGKDVSHIPEQSSGNKQENAKLKVKVKKLYKKLQFNFMDLIIFCGPIFAHSIYYCQIQSSCMSAEDATIWNCYNAFGYRLYNYVFVSYFHFCSSFVIKYLYRNKCKEMAMTKITEPIEPIEKPSKFKTWWEKLPLKKWWEKSPLKKWWEKLSLKKWWKESPLKKWWEESPLKKRWDKINYHLSLWSSIITCLFVGALLLPYLLTHAIPMMIAYIFMYAIYFAATAFVLFPIFLTNLPYNTRFISIENSIGVSSLFIGAWILYTFPILISTTFNYSQYLYYGEDYFTTMTNEYNSRDTTTFFKLLQDSANTRFHTSINFF